MHWLHNHVYLSCHVYEGHTDQNAPYWVSLGLITCTPSLTVITFCQVSPNPMAVPKPLFTALKEKALNLNQNIHF